MQDGNDGQFIQIEDANGADLHFGGEMAWPNTAARARLMPSSERWIDAHSLRLSQSWVAALALPALLGGGFGCPPRTAANGFAYQGQPGWRGA